MLPEGWAPPDRCATGNLCSTLPSFGCAGMSPRRVSIFLTDNATTTAPYVRFPLSRTGDHVGQQQVPNPMPPHNPKAHPVSQGGIHGNSVCASSQPFCCPGSKWLPQQHSMHYASTGPSAPGGALRVKPHPGTGHSLPQFEVKGPKEGFGEIQHCGCSDAKSPSLAAQNDAVCQHICLRHTQEARCHGHRTGAAAACAKHHHATEPAGVGRGLVIARGGGHEASGHPPPTYTSLVPLLWQCHAFGTTACIFTFLYPVISKERDCWGHTSFQQAPSHYTQFPNHQRKSSSLAGSLSVPVLCIRCHAAPTGRRHRAMRI